MTSTIQLAEVQAQSECLKEVCFEEVAYMK